MAKRSVGPDEPSVDPWPVRLAIVGLLGIVLAVVIGTILLGKDSPTGLIAIATAALGPVGMLASASLRPRWSYRERGGPPDSP